MLLVTDNKKNTDALYLKLLVKYLQLDKYNGIKVIEVSKNQVSSFKDGLLPKLITNETVEIISLPLISQNLLALINHHEELIGNSPESRSNTFKFFEMIANFRSEPQKICDILQLELEGKMFLNGSNSIKACDIYVFSWLVDYLFDKDTAFKTNYYNIFRYASYIQSLNGITQSLEELRVPLLDKRI